MIDKLLRHRVIPVIVIEDADHAEPLAEALLEGGLDVIEITCRTPAASEAMKRIRKAFPEMIVGAGTVVTPDNAKMCIDAGVRFGLAPGINPETVRYFQENGALFIPGVMTPSEIEIGLSLGCRILKYFPAKAAGGPGMLKTIAAPFAPLGVQFCPSGGVNQDNMTEWLDLPIVRAVGGSWMASRQQIADRQWDVITSQVKAALNLIKEVL